MLRKYSPSATDPRPSVSCSIALANHLHDRASHGHELDIASHASTASPLVRAFPRTESGCAHVDRPRNHLCVSVVDQALGKSFRDKKIIDFSSGVEQNRITDFALLRIGSHGEHIRSISHEQLLDEHLVLRDWLANLAAASVLAPPSGEQKLQSGADTVHQS